MPASLLYVLHFCTKCHFISHNWDLRQWIWQERTQRCILDAIFLRTLWFTYQVIQLFRLLFLHAIVHSSLGKSVLRVFLGCFWAYVRQPHSHKSWDKPMPFTSINSTNPRTNPWNFGQKILRIGGAGKWHFVLFFTTVTKICHLQVLRKYIVVNLLEFVVWLWIDRRTNWRPSSYSRARRSTSSFMLKIMDT